jgi:hypothetical protein
MDVEQLTEEYKKECNNLFPNIDKKSVEPTADTFIKILEVFFNEISKSKQLKYIEDKPEGVDNAEYLSNIPEGVKSFEKWTQKGLSVLTNDILMKFNVLWPSNISYIYFAKYLDDQNFESFVKNVNIPVEQHMEIKNAYDSFFEERELKPILLAIGAAAMGLNNTAHTLIKHAIQQLIFEDQDFYEVLDQAKEIEVIRNKSKQDSKKSNDVRHAKNRKMKEYVISLYLKTSNPSVKNFSEQIAEKVMDYAKNSEELKKLPGKNKSYTIFSAARAAERMIGEYNKEQKNKKKLSS